ncbi:MAG: hypothetical protein AAFO91_03135, partial [Bacteroidota bacterium]
EEEEEPSSSSVALDAPRPLFAEYECMPTAWKRRRLDVSGHVALREPVPQHRFQDDPKLIAIHGKGKLDRQAQEVQAFMAECGAMKLNHCYFSVKNFASTFHRPSIASPWFEVMPTTRKRRRLNFAKEAQVVAAQRDPVPQFQLQHDPKLIAGLGKEKLDLLAAMTKAYMEECHAAKRSLDDTASSAAAAAAAAATQGLDHCNESAATADDEEEDAPLNDYSHDDDEDEDEDSKTYDDEDHQPEDEDLKTDDVSKPSEDSTYATAPVPLGSFYTCVPEYGSRVVRRSYRLRRRPVP